MARRGLGNIINSVKHIVQQPIVTTAAGAILNITVVDAVDAPAATTPNQVQVGSIIKAVYVELWAISDDGFTSSVSAVVYKNPGSALTLTHGQAAIMNTWNNKKNALKTFQGLISQEANNTMPIFKEWIAIPKGKQRFGDGDSLMVAVDAISNGVTTCGIFVYKEYQ